MTAVNDVLVSRYRLVRLLGRGGMSDVYEAFDESTGRDVAIKIVRSSDPEFGRRLAQEARALESFEHPGLIRLLDIGAVGGQPFLVMELIVGQTLAQRLREGPLSSRETADVGARLADALAYVHERGVIHRDVKPSNILISENGDAWLGDFGIAKLHEASAMTSTGATMGTVSYMAPEQLEDSQVTPSADIWSLGVILLECLTAQRVYEGTPSEVLARRLAGPVALPVELPVPWKMVLTGMLTLRPDQRLKDSEVSVFLSTSAYDAPWIGADSDMTTRVRTSRTDDHTAFMSGATGGRHEGDETKVIKTTASANVFRLPSRFRALAVLAVLAVVAIVGVGSYFLFGSRPGPTVSTTTTSTTVPPGGAALTALKSQVLAGETARNVNAASGQTIAEEANLAQAAYASGKTQQAVIDLELTQSAITNGVSNHLIGPVEGQLLQSDLRLFAGALHLSSAVTTTTTTSSTTTTTTTTTTSTTTTTTTPFPNSPFGNGNGN